MATVTSAVPVSSATARSRGVMDLLIIAQDPTVLRPNKRILTVEAHVPAVRIEDGPRTARFQVVDFDASTGRYQSPTSLPRPATLARATNEQLVANRAFHAQQVYAVAARTLATFEFALGRRLSWGFDGHQLYLVPHAFCEANAFYSFDDRAILFGYAPGLDGRNVYTCLSHDVVAHETTHAVLDGLRHRFLEPGLPDQAAFHEGLADIVALLSVFSLRDVVEVALGPATRGGRLDTRRVSSKALQRNVLTGIAEQMGRLLTQGRGALRQSALRPPPPDWATLPQYAEPHARGEVLVAVVLDVLIDLWRLRLKAIVDRDGSGRATIDRARAAEEGAKAASHLLTMIIRSLDYLPPVEFEFADLVEAIVRADAEVVPDDDLHYRDALVKQFARAGIDRPSGVADDLSRLSAPPRYRGLNFEAMRTDPDEVFRFIWENAALLGVDVAYYTHVESVLPSQRVGPDGLVVAESVAAYVQELELTAGELLRRLRRSRAARRDNRPARLPRGLDEDATVRVWGGGTFVFDQFGRSKLHIHKALGDWERQLRRLTYLDRAGLYDRKGRLGVSADVARGQAFAELHAADTDSGEAW